MSKRLILRGALVAALAAGGAAAFQDGAQAGDATPRIIGGVPASENYSFIAALNWDQGGNYRFRCGGSLIAEQWVLTAAHCVYDQAASAPYDPALFDVRIGSNDRTTGGSTARVTATYVNPHYWNEQDDRESDIALLKLDRPVSEQPVALADEEPAAGSDVRVIGWGLTDPAQTQAQVNARQLDTSVVPKDHCVVGGTQDLTVSDLCVDDPDDIGTGTCSGDSGAPLVRSVAGRWELVGHNSRSVGNSSGTDNGCGSTPSVMPSTAYHRSWISSVIAG